MVALKHNSLKGVTFWTPQSAMKGKRHLTFVLVKLQWGEIFNKNAKWGGKQTQMSLPQVLDYICTPPPFFFFIKNSDKLLEPCTVRSDILKCFCGLAALPCVGKCKKKFNEWTNLTQGHSWTHRPNTQGWSAAPSPPRCWRAQTKAVPSWKPWIRFYYLPTTEPFQPRKVEKT